MSKRAPFAIQLRPVSLLSVFILTALLLPPTAVQAQICPYVEINGMDSYPGGFVTLEVKIKQGASPITVSGFDFLIGYYQQVLTLADVEEGYELKNCGWEYFTYRTSTNSGCVDSCPSGLIRLVAVADINNGSSHPTCFPDRPSFYIALAHLTFQVAASADYVSFSPVSFYWKDCGDNVLTTIAGDTVFFAESVYNLFGEPPLPAPTTLPSFDGTPESCISVPGKVALRSIDYLNGRVQIFPQLINRGDLNLNGISNEVADLMIFWNYYYFGMSAFDPIRWRQQVAQTDINGDGVTLTFRDFVFLYRIVVGDTPPVPKSSAQSLSATFIQDTIAANVTVASSSKLAGILLRFEGLIEPTRQWPVWQLGWSYWPDTVRNVTTVIWLGPDRDCCSYGQMLTNTGKGRLILAEAVDWFDSDVKTHIITTGVTPTYGDVNGSGSINIADVIYLIVYIFQGGAYPIDPYHGDLDCDGSCNIGDAVLLLNYIFASGPAPCGNR